jgi:hypothetical protein
VTLNDDLVAAEDVQREQRHRSLAAFLDRLAEERGPLDTAEDRAEIARFSHLLGVILTADPEDLGRLAAPYRNIVIEDLAPRSGHNQPE